MLKNIKGITIIALIITIVIMLIIAGVGINLGTKQIERTKLEDLKTEMLLIQGRAKIIVDKKNFGDTYEDEGMVLLEDINNNTTGFNVTEELQTKLPTAEGTELYIWNAQAMENNHITEIAITNTEFFIIDYNTCEVYYSLGYNGRYSLTEIQGL